MTRNSNELEQAVSRTLRDSLEKLQRTSGELDQAVGDLVAACASSRVSNSLPPMLRARTAAASLAASLEVLSKFVLSALQGVDSPEEQELLATVAHKAAPVAPIELRPAAEAATAAEAPPSPKTSFAVEPAPAAVEPPPPLAEVTPAVEAPRASEPYLAVEPLPLAVEPPPSAEALPSVEPALVSEQALAVEPPVLAVAPPVAVEPPPLAVEPPLPAETLLAVEVAPVAEAPSALEPPPLAIEPSVSAEPTPQAEPVAQEAELQAQPQDLELPVPPAEEELPVVPAFSSADSTAPVAASSEAPVASYTSYTEELPPETHAFDVLALPPEQRELHRRANRVAKVSMQDVKMLRPRDVELGRERKDLCLRLRDDIEKAHREYDRRFRAIQDDPVDYFYDWMVEILGNGDPATLGEYPYPSPVLRR
jgi:hypothetical protein